MNAKWDIRFLKLARHIAGWSRDPSTKVGAVIVDREGRIVSTGYNGFPRGVDDRPERLADRDTRLMMTVHAEKNAILFARRDLRGLTLYTTFVPCSRYGCAGLIVQAGIARVVAVAAPPALAERWHADIEATKTMFNEAGVNLEIYELGM